MARNANYIVEGNYDKPVTEINIKEVPDFNISDFDFEDEKALYKYIRRVETVCRQSFEYKQFIYFLKNYGNMNKCSFMKFLDTQDIPKLRIEIHHEPITLFDIALTIFRKRQINGESLHEDMIAKEVMYQHYKLHVGLIPLTTTVHEMVHNQFLFIPTQAVMGAWDKFVEEYRQYMPIDTLSNLDSIIQHSENYDPEKEMAILNAGFVRINVEDDGYQASTEELFNYLKSVYDDLEERKNK